MWAYSNLIVSGITGLTVGIDDIGVWIGAHDITTESMWVWVDGQPWFDDIGWGTGTRVIFLKRGVCSIVDKAPNYRSTNPGAQAQFLLLWFYELDYKLGSVTVWLSEMFNPSSLTHTFFNSVPKLFNEVQLHLYKIRASLLFSSETRQQMTVTNICTLLYVWIMLIFLNLPYAFCSLLQLLKMSPFENMPLYILMLDSRNLSLF